jgi:hypothetical protein
VQWLGFSPLLSIFVRRIEFRQVGSKPRTVHLHRRASLNSVIVISPSLHEADVLPNMDPLSISASIVAVLQLSETVVQYLNNVKNAHKDRQKILDEVSSAIGILFLLKGHAERANSRYAWSIIMKSPGGPLEQFEMALQRLVSKLAPVGRLFWPFQQGEIKEIVNTIERQKALFNLALQNDHMCVSNRICFKSGTHFE